MFRSEANFGEVSAALHAFVPLDFFTRPGGAKTNWCVLLKFMLWRARRHTKV